MKILTLLFRPSTRAGRLRLQAIVGLIGIITGLNLSPLIVDVNGHVTGSVSPVKVNQDSVTNVFIP